MAPGAKRWWDDQLRQNELVLADALVLRYPSVVIRTDELLVAEQLRRALLLWVIFMLTRSYCGGSA
jgi:hypothetical protein